MLLFCMSTLAEIEAALPSLSAEELARIEATLQRLRRDRGLDARWDCPDVRLDGLPWPKGPEEIAALLWLRQWYQTGGSDRTSIVRHLEFLRMLVKSGELEL